MTIRSERADEIYVKIKEKIASQKGKMIALELETGNYYIGETLEEAYDKAHEKHPSKTFFYKRIGFKPAVSM